MDRKEVLEYRILAGKELKDRSSSLSSGWVQPSTAAMDTSPALTVDTDAVTTSAHVAGNMAPNLVLGSGKADADQSLHAFPIDQSADHVRPTPSSDTQKFVDWFGRPWDGVLKPAKIRDGRFAKEHKKLNIQCDGCEEWKVGNNAGGFANDEKIPPNQRDEAWSRGWDARWYCIRCWGRYWNVSSPDEVLKRLNYADRDSKKAKYKL